jgi:DivIVA domain-containing protein
MALLLEILVVGVVVAAVSMFMSGWLPGMSPAPPDRTDDGLPAGRLAPKDVDRARFGLAFRGYRMEEVDSVLDRLRDQMTRYEAELASLRADGPDRDRREDANGLHD